MMESELTEKPALLSASAVLLVILIFVVPIPGSKAIPQESAPVLKESYQLDPGWNLDESWSWGADVNILSVVQISVDMNADFFAGIALPFEMALLYPEWLVGNQGFNVSLLASGNEGGKAGVKLEAGLKITVGALLWEAVLFDDTKGLDLVSEFTTPIGDSVSGKVEGRVELGSVTIDIPLLGGTLTAYLGMTARYLIEAGPLAEVDARGVSLQNEYSDAIVFSEQRSRIDCALRTKPQAQSDVVFSVDNLVYKVSELIFAITGFFIEFEYGDTILPRFSLYIPEISIPVSGFTLDCNDQVNSVSIPMMIPNNPLELDIDLMPSIGIGLIAITIVVLAISRRR